MLRTRGMILVGLLLLLLGAIDPLEGSLFILAGSAMAAAGAHFEHSRRRRLLACAFGLVAAGVASMIIVSLIGGVGGRSGRSPWWLLLLAPYVLGWAAGVAGGALWLVDTFNGTDESGAPAPR